MKDPRFPVGKFQMPERIDETVIEKAIAVIRDFPARVEVLIQNASPETLKKSYREGGWSVYQLIHHVADSHYNAFIRTKLALTEDTPAIKPYREASSTQHPAHIAPICIASARLSTIPSSLITLSSLKVRMVMPLTCTSLPPASTPNNSPF